MIVIAVIILKDYLAALDSVVCHIPYFKDSCAVRNPVTFPYVMSILGHCRKVKLININASFNTFGILFTVIISIISVNRYIRIKDERLYL